MKHRCQMPSRSGLRVLFGARFRCVAAGTVLAVWIALSVPAVFAQGENGGRLVTFTKEFPGSVPPYYSVVVRESGAAVYKVEPEDDQPVEFQLPAGVVSQIFELAGKISASPGRSLESKRRVANMGKKTVEVQEGGEPFTVSFNHTEVPEALELLALFERISTTEQHLLRLEYMVQFDRLGVVKALLQLEVDLNANRLVGANQLVPMLERIRNDRAIAQIAKGRAAQILGKIQAETF